MKNMLIKNFSSKKVNRDDGTENSRDPVAVEKSYNLLINGTRIASLMASPSDLREMGYGYLLAEGFVKEEDQIIEVKVRGDEIHLFIEGSEKIEDLLELRSSACIGAHWDQQEEEISVKSDLTVDRSTIFRTLHHLKSQTYDKTSGSHSASLMDEDGTLLLKAEDIGRHNTYDKIIGRALIEGIDLSRKILLSTGRQSAGMIMKAARSGIPIVVTKAAPLSSGVKAARETDMTLICFADDKKIKIFTGTERIKTNKNC